MQPVPTEFVSAATDFKRRLRVRHVPVQERLPAQDAFPFGSRGSSRERRSLLSKRTSLSLPPDSARKSTKEPKPWLVEAAGALFDRPGSLRGLRACAPRLPRYFIAVAPDLERRVLVEGFRVRKRCSIPCSGTPKEALDAFGRQQQAEGARSEQRATGRAQGVRASVLAVNLPPEIDVVAHREGGFLIRCKELPPSCFSRVKRMAGGEAA
mmetsp:Transcript_14897/g.44951  ORF Transcript_14897/g.44951 Transcript_14897/m.44951 type:complete len:210 (-) Transcript_14897:52-681(-)